MAYTEDDIYDYLVAMREEINDRLDKIENKLNNDSTQSVGKIKI